jgi:IS30 family transposase
MKNYTHLTEKERETIYLWVKNWLKQNVIAKSLNRNTWTISREIKRNSSLILKDFNNNIVEKIKKENYHYLPDRANNKYKKRKKEAWKLRPILKWWEVFFEVIKRLKELHSPEIIAWR